MDDMLQTILLRDGPLGERVEPWLRSKNDIDLIVATSKKIRNDQDGRAPTSGIDEIKEHEPDLLLSAGYRHIIPPDTIESATVALNCHNSYLPYARGANANVWSIVEDVPVGVTIHEIVEKVDSGPIVAQHRVPLYPDDTGKSLYTRLIDATIGLLEQEWASIRDNTYETKENPIQNGTYHRGKEFDELRKLNLETEMSMKNLLNKLRALTFPPFNNAYFERNGKKYFVEINIQRAESLEEDIQSARENE
jgi:methionyl-tRNA formyltransferase